MRTKLPKNRPYISAKIGQFWIGHHTEDVPISDFHPHGIDQLAQLSQTWVSSRINIHAHITATGMIKASWSLLLHCEERKFEADR